jgi:hypothetical protein
LPELPPAEPPPEKADEGQIGAITRRLLNDKDPKARRKAALELENLGKKAWTARRALCAAMLDSEPAVARAAQDVLREIDRALHLYATAILINRDMSAVRRAGELGGLAEPLTPLMVHIASDTSSSLILVKEAVKTLAAIAPADKWAAQCMAQLLSRRDRVDVWETVVIELRKMEYRVEAGIQVLEVAKEIRIPEGIRREAIVTLLSVLDRLRLRPGEVKKNTKIQKQIQTELWELRLDPSPAVRQLVLDNKDRIKL